MLALILPSTATLAANKNEQETPWYQVEVIIFANLEQVGLASETWPDTSKLKYRQIITLRHPDDTYLNPTTNKAFRQSTSKTDQLPDFNAADGNNMPVPYELLPASQLQLSSITKKLQRSRSYQPLLHIAWRQPTVGPKSSTPVYIFDGIEKPAISDISSQQAVMQTPSAGDGRFSSVAVGSFPYDSSQYGRLFPATPGDTLVGASFQKLSGTLKLSVSRYLHLEVDLNYRVQVLKEETIIVEPEASIPNLGFSNPGNQLSVGQISGQQEPQTYIQRRQALQNFHIYETRRLRSKETHYYDHPLYGIIARVVPYELPKKEEVDFDPAAQAFTTKQPNP